LPRRTEGRASPAADAVKDNGLATAGYYILLFLIVCFVVGIVGKILRVFDLTQRYKVKRQLTGTTLWAFAALYSLIAGAYGAYWEFTVQGSMILPEALHLSMVLRLTRCSGQLPC
jgi:cytochrome c oxidase subunit 2